MRTLLTLLILLWFKTIINADHPKFFEYGYFPRWSADLPKRFNGSIYYLYETTPVLLTNKVHPITTAYFMFEKKAIMDPIVDLRVTLRRIKTDVIGCNENMVEKLTILGETTCTHNFKWSEATSIDFKGSTISTKLSYTKVEVFTDQTGATDVCVRKPYNYNSTHAVFGVQFQAFDSLFCPSELIMPHQFFLFLHNSDNPTIENLETLNKTIEAADDKDNNVRHGGSNMFALIWVIVALALLCLLLLLTVLVLIFNYFRTQRRIRSLSNMITNNQSNWSVAGTEGSMKPIDSIMTVVPAIEKSNENEKNKHYIKRTQTKTQSKTMADETTDQTSTGDFAQSSKTKITKPSVDYFSAVSNKSKRQMGIFREKQQLDHKRVDKLVPLSMNTPTEHYTVRRPWDMFSQISRKISKKTPIPPLTSSIAPTTTEKAIKTEKTNVTKTVTAAPPTEFYSVQTASTQQNM